MPTGISGLYKNTKGAVAARENNDTVEAVYSKDNWIKGELQDTIIDRDGNETVLPADHNLVVQNCSTLIAALLKSIWDNSGNPDDPVTSRSGIRYWAIGCEPDPTEPVSYDTTLKKEFFRKEIKPGDISFVGANGEVSTNPTNKLKIQVTIEYDEANMVEGETDEATIGEWTEMAIFAGPEATTVPNSGFMMNRKIHPKIGKTDHIKVRRTLIFTF